MTLYVGAELSLKGGEGCLEHLFEVVEYVKGYDGKIFAILEIKE